MNQYASPTYLIVGDDAIRVPVPAETYRVGDFIRIRTLNNVDTEGDTYRITGPMCQEIVNKDDYRLYPAERATSPLLRGTGFPDFG